MVICPRCQQPVDETVRTTCPLCATPIVGTTASPAAADSVSDPCPRPVGGGTQPGLTPQPAVIPPPTAAPGAPMNVPTGNMGLNANQRMSLNGEVFEVPVPISTPAGNSQYQAKSPYGAPPKAAVKQEQPKSGSPIVPIVVCVVLALLAFGGYYYYMNRTNPKEQATKYFAAVKENNFKVIYNTMEVDSEQFKDEKEFVEKKEAELNNANPQMKQLLQQIMAGLQFSVGAPKSNNGSEATVPVTVTGSVTISMFGVTKSQEVNETKDVKMKNFQGIWKVSKDNGTLTGAGNGVQNMKLPGM